MIPNDNVLRHQVLAWYRAGLERVAGQTVVRQWLTEIPWRKPVRLVAIGKAAEAMLEGAVAVLGRDRVEALSITKQGYSYNNLCAAEHIHCLEAGHPLPDADSLAAGQYLLKFIAQSSAEEDWVFLVSGGASSLVEVPVAGLELDDLIALNDWLLGSGLDIVAMNRIRKAVSRIKGGRLAGYLAKRRVFCGLISDVPNNDPASIGSGLLVPGEETGLDDLPLPDWLRQKLVAASPPDPPTTEAPPIECQILARLEDAMTAAAEAAGSQGWAVQVHTERLQGEAAETGQQLARELKLAGPGVHIWGGETTVRLPPSPGRGGRNQHLALAAAMELAGDPDCLLLAAGTDGSDGPTEAAGALVDGRTLERGEIEGLSAQSALQQADAGRFLEASGDLIETGPTGTNVMDLVIGLKRHTGDDRV